MFSTKLTTVDESIIANGLIPPSIIPLISRRTNNKRIFGKLEIIAPHIATATAAATAPRQLIAGFLLDTSGSMQGIKIQHAINTIKQLAEILLSERNGKTIPIRSWIYVITFNSEANLAIPFQEITAETLPNIITQLDEIRADGSTNYENAFKKQSEVLADIIKTLNANTADAPEQHYHIIRFFETDGEITDGSRNTEMHYKMMRNTSATSPTSPTSATDPTPNSFACAHSLAPPASATDPTPNSFGTAVGGRNPPQLTYEDYVLGYGTDVDLNCLKMLASPYQRSEYLADKSHTNRKRQYTDAYNCSSLITIIKPEDIGWQVGELLFKVIMRYGYKIQVSISSANTELFEYQSHQWSNVTTIHSIIYGETKPLYIQYTPPPPPAATASDEDTTTTTPGDVLVKIQYSNQFTGSTYTYEFAHVITHGESATATATTATTATAATALILTVTNGPDHPSAIAIILGMIQIEIFKQFREIETSTATKGQSKYDKNTIVREAYKTLRMLKSLGSITHISVPVIIAQTENLITDVKVIIGLTTIDEKKEQDAIIHARRICSVEQDVFNTGANISRKYVENEEDYEEEATRVINARVQGGVQDNDNDNDNVASGEPIEEEYADDSIPSRITTMVIDTPCSQDQGQQGDYNGGGGGRYNRYAANSSELRTLCARIALAKKRNEEFTTEQLYDQVCQYGNAASIHGWQHRYGKNNNNNDDHDGPRADDTFSSTPMNDEYTQRRMGMMRQMSSKSQSS